MASKQVQGQKRLNSEILSASKRVIAGRPVQRNLMQKAVPKGGDGKPGRLRSVMDNGGESKDRKAPVGKLRQIMCQ